MAGPELHPDVVPLGFLIGSWMGEGKGEYPTIESFAYGEEVRFWHVGKPFLAYTQRTWALDDGRPLHSESGYWRMGGPGRVELVLAHPTGVAEVEDGTLDGTSLSLATSSVVRTPTAKLVERLERDIRVEGDVLTYELRMSAVGQPLISHLTGELQRGAS